MGWKTTYKGILDACKTLLEANGAFKNVVFGGQFRVGKLPMCIISPETDTPSPSGNVGGTRNFLVDVNFDIYVLVRETEPADIVEEVTTVTGAVMDVIFANPTLSGTVKDCYPSFHAPGEIRTPDRLYYGGVVRCTAKLFYSP